MDISSTKIRQNIKTKKTTENLIPPEVSEFIRKKGLYT
jgi:nicotinic acid mononucleotide adenylyltransferase